MFIYKYINFKYIIYVEEPFLLTKFGTFVNRNHETIRIFYNNNYLIEYDL
jgi:hypothetical protein